MLAAAIFILSSLLVGACAESETETAISTNDKQEVPEHKRMEVGFFRGINEPRSFDWNLILFDTDRLKANGFNSVALEPPLLITERAGGKPRVIIEGAAVTAPGLVDSIHAEGFAVFLAPTTASPEFAEKIIADDNMLAQLSEDVVYWAGVAEERQTELFAPLSRCNLALGTDTARTWLREILPAVREAYTGPVAAKVVADVDQPISEDGHDFERLDYTGYDYLVVDVHPWGEYYDEESFKSYVIDVIERAVRVSERDGLQGVIIGDLRLGRSNDSPDRREGEPTLTAEQQADAVKFVAESVTPSVKGAFYYGWTLAGYGSRDYPAEGALVHWFVGLTTEDDAGVSTSTTGSTVEDPVVENG